MRNKFRHIFCASLLFMFPILSISLTSCNASSETLDYSDLPKDFNVVEDFRNKKVTNSSMIKGVDVSSYTSVLTNFLYEKKIQDSTILDNSTLVTKYNFDQMDNLKVKNSEMSLYEYTNKNLYSYIDENGNRTYDNIFKILKEQAGVNSIRLRVWVDPKDENNNWYTSGINSTLESTIWTINKAKENGISHFQIDFHYSDFWADPGRQYVPKSWSNLNTTEMKTKLEDYTYSSIMEIYNKTNLFPASVQVGNEITDGMLWKTNEDQKFADGHKNISNTIDYFNAGAKGIKKVNQYIEDNKLGNKIETVLHIEGPQSIKRRGIFRQFMSNKELFDNVDVIGLTYYPFWNSNIDYFYNVLSNVYGMYDKKVIIEEFSVPYHVNPTGYIGDINTKDFKGRIPVTSNGQVILLNSFLEAISRVFPNVETGFYYWEPGWLNVGNSSWATPEGIKYAYNDNYESLKNQKDGFSWSNQGLFDENGILLPIGRVLKNFNRIKNDSDIQIKFDNQLSIDTINPVSDDYSAINTYIGNNTPLYVDQNNFYKIDISKELYQNYSGKYSNEINYYSNNNDIEFNEKQIIDLIKETYPRIMWHQVNFKNFKKQENGYTIDIISNADSFYYKNTATITINLKQYSDNHIDLTTAPITLNRNDKEWSNKIIDHIKNNVNDIGTIIYNSLKITGGIDNSNFWLYDNQYGVNRYADWLLLKNSNIFLEGNTSEFDRLNNTKFDWPSNGIIDNLIDSNGYLYFGIKKQLNDIEFNKDLSFNKSTYSLVGKESWKYIDVLVFKLKVNLN